MNSGKRVEDFSLDALRSGDRAEFARLVDKYHEMIYRLAIKMVNNPQDAEDILQETFIKAYRHLEKFDGRSSLSTWLYRIATNEALMFLRRQKPDMVSVDETLDTGEGEVEPLKIVDWSSLPEDELMSAEAQVYLDKAVEKLSPSLRVVFVLRDIQSLSTRETAEVLNISETAVKTRLSRARLQLREELTSYYGERVRA
ncbi:MAG: sigma-70 family RNA polymerase sigma factor [Anaerolineales bacterium]|jgi:RNA polymerase sigma-70 factor (ECF subfamily)|nr:sigma-70 family RNA polymerase sigma factor [Anaerolineales bacterium]